MPVDIENMRSEVSIQSASAGSTQATPGAGSVDMEQLREIIRELVLEIVEDDIYNLFRTRGL